MPWTSEHSKWLNEIENNLITSDGKKVVLLEFQPDLNDLDLMKKWAKHFRNHYCSDTEIDLLREGTGFSRKEYLTNIKFPSQDGGFGPGIRSGDFGEILISDYLEFVMMHWVPRTRYRNKTIRDESSKGSDLIGIKLFDNNETVNDILTMFEVKAQFSGTKTKPRLQEAINDSKKDELRKAESLNAIKQRLLDEGKLDDVKKIARFQNPVDSPYIEQYGAAALFSSNIFCNEVITESTTTDHPKILNLFLIVVRGDDLMSIVHKLYELAADEA